MLPIDKILKPEAILFLKNENGIFRCMSPEFEKKLEEYLPVFEDMRTKEGKAPSFNPEEYPLLPYLESVKNDFEWKFRRQGMDILTKMLPSEPQQILEIGAWNGWLSNRLAGMGHDVIAVDYFADKKDGLGAKSFYKNDWIALQTDIAETGIFNDKVFDIIIVNHGLQFFTDPLNYLENLKPLMKPGGRIICLGLSFYKNSSGKKHKVEKFSADHFRKYGFPIFIHPTKGYLNRNDKNFFRTIGYEFMEFPEMKLRNFMAIILRNKPSYNVMYWKNR